MIPHDDEYDDSGQNHHKVALDQKVDSADLNIGVMWLHSTMLTYFYEKEDGKTGAFI